MPSTLSCKSREKVCVKRVAVMWHCEIFTKAGCDLAPCCGAKKPGNCGSWRLSSSNGVKVWRLFESLERAQILEKSVRCHQFRERCNDTSKSK